MQNHVKELHGTCSFLAKKGNGFKTRVVISIEKQAVLFALKAGLPENVEKVLIKKGDVLC